MKSVAMIGLGLNDENGITLEGLEEARRAEQAFAEFYTNLMPNLDRDRLEHLIGKKITVLDRRQLEEENGLELARAAARGRVVLLVPGDPLIATTHIALRLALTKKNIPVRVVHGPSIVSAICGATGLQNYKFGKTVTIPNEQHVPRSVVDTISDNADRGLHTLLLLDIREGEKDQLSVNQALTRVLLVEPRFDTRLAVGVARIGAPDEYVKASRVRTLVNENFGNPPQSLIFVGKPHFVEVDALKTFCGARDSDFGDPV